MVLLGALGLKVKATFQRSVAQSSNSLGGDELVNRIRSHSVICVSKSPQNLEVNVIITELLLRL